MKTTLDLPDSLMRQAEIRAAAEGLKLQELIADLVKQGLERPPATTLPEWESSWYFDPETGFPVSRTLNTPGFVPPTLAESLALIERCNEEEALSRTGLLR